MPPNVADWQPRNPLGETPNLYRRKPFTPYSRRQDVELEGILAPGTIRRAFWRALAGMTGAGPAFSWSRNSLDRGGPVRGQTTTPEIGILSTRHFLTVGNQRSNPFARRAVGTFQLQPTSPIVHAGNVQGRPSIREQILSLGSRIPPLNAGAGQ